MIKIWQFRVYCSLLSYYPLCPHTEITGKCILPARPAQTQLGNIKYLRIFLLFLYNEMFLLCVFTQTISTVVMGGHWLLALQWDCKFWTSQMAARCNPWFPVFQSLILHHAMLCLLRNLSTSQKATWESLTEWPETRAAAPSKKSKRHRSNEDWADIWEMSEGWALRYLPCYSPRTQRCPGSDISTSQQAPGPGHWTQTSLVFASMF